MARYFEFELQPIRVPPHWRVTYNIWFEVDPSPDTMDWFSESMMLGVHSDDGRYAIDLTFSPELDPNGTFNVTFYECDTSKTKKHSDAWSPIGGNDFSCRLDALKSIEQFMADVWQTGAPILDDPIAG